MKKQWVDWVILTKHPEDTKDYQVLACSGGGFYADSYYKYINKWMTGEIPSGISSSSPAAPWYQFGIIKEPERQQVVLQQKWTGYSDYRGRPVLMTVCLMLPFNELAKVHCGYKQMIDIFEQEGVKEYFAERMEEISRGVEKTDFEKIAVLLPEWGEVSRWMKGAVEEVGAESCIQAANLLLQSSLGIGSVDIGSVEERVKWLDAIMAMLPYGLRVDCPASLWASSSVDHSMRLYWGYSVRKDHRHMEVPIGDKVGECISKQEAYIEDLQVLWGRVSHEKILDYLGGQSEELSFANPIPVDFFDGFENELIVLNRIRKEAPKISSRTYAAAVNILEKGLLDRLTEEEQFDFITNI